MVVAVGTRDESFMFPFFMHYYALFYKKREKENYYAKE